MQPVFRITSNVCFNVVDAFAVLCPHDSRFFETVYFSYTNRPSVHTKPVNSLIETALFLKRSPEWFKAPSTRIRINKYAVSKISEFVGTWTKALSTPMNPDIFQKLHTEFTPIGLSSRQNQ